MVEPLEYDSSSIGAYAVTAGEPHAGEVAVEINDGQLECIVYLTPEESFRLGDDLATEGAQALAIGERAKIRRAS